MEYIYKLLTNQDFMLWVWVILLLFGSSIATFILKFSKIIFRPGKNAELENENLRLRIKLQQLQEKDNMPK